LASALHDSANCLRFRKTAPFPLFQSCQQHKAMKELNCTWGTEVIICSQCRFWVRCPWGVWRPTASQKPTAKWQSKTMCSGVSCGATQITQPGASTMFFRKRLDPHWILPLTSSQMNSCTRGGVALFQMKDEVWSADCPLAFRRL
jgi:hypothetical protein